MSKRYLTIGLIIIAISTIINVGIFEKTNLKQPLFLEHYYELELDETTYFKLYYLDQMTQSRKIVEVYFPEHPYLDDLFRVDTRESRLASPHHMQYCTWIHMEKEFEETIQTDHITISEIGVLLSDGETMEIPIGEIIFYPDTLMTREEREQLIDIKSISESTEGVSIIEAEVGEDIEILGIETDLGYDLSEQIIIKVNGEPIETTQLYVGDKLTIQCSFSSGTNDPSWFNVYSVEPRIQVKTQAGEIKELGMHQLQHWPEFEAWESYKYISERKK